MTPSIRSIGAAVLLAAGSLAACNSSGTTSAGAASQGSKAAIVGTWLVKHTDAPFPYHMYVFNSDGTLQQANPDAGDPKMSDSDGKGVWVVSGTGFKAKWVEIMADRSTHQYAGRAEISFEAQVQGDHLTGSGSAVAFDAEGKQVMGPSPTALDGTRISVKP